MGFAHGETVTRIQPGQVDDPYSGETRPDWDNPTITVIPGCVVYPFGSPNELIAIGREQGIERLTVLVPRGYTLDYGDRACYRGNQYEVVGWTYQYHSPFTGWEPGGQAEIERKVG